MDKGRMRLAVTLFILAVACIQCGTSLSWLRSFSGQDLVSSVRSSIRNLPPSLPQHTIGSGGTIGIQPPSPPHTSMSMLDRSGGEGQAMFVSLIRTANQTMHQLQPTAAVARRIQSKLSHTVSDLWEAFTKGRSGLLLMIMPVLVAQLRILRTTFPFVVERLSQYVNPPLALLTALAVLRPWSAWNGAAYLRGALWASVAVGGVFMLYDSYTAGASWRALQGQQDSYALVTGASSGLGRDLARRLHRSGYNLILVDDAAPPLQQLRDELASTYNLPAEEGGFKWTAESAVGYFPNAVGGIKLLQQAGNATVSRLRAEPRVQRLAQSAQRAAQSARERIQTAVQTHTTIGKVVASKASPLQNASVSRSTNVPGSSPPSSSSFVRTLAGHIFPTPAADANIQTLENTATQATTTATASGASNKNHPSTTAKTIESMPAVGLSAQTARKPAGAVHVVQTDFRDPDAPWAVLRALQELSIQSQVEVLVHAAELRPPATALSEQPLYAIRDALQVNAHFPVLLTKLLLPDLLQRAAGPNKLPHESVSGNLRKDADDRSASSKRSSASRADAAQEGVGSGHGGCRVLFVSSVNPTAPSSMTSIFSASKALVASFAQSLRREVLSQGVLVGVAHVGPLRSPPRTAECTDRTAPRMPHVDSALPAEFSIPTGPEGCGSADAADWDRQEASGDPHLRRPEETVAGPEPWLRSVPFLALSAEAAGREVFAALSSGRDAVTPGIANKLYRHGVARILSAPALAALHQMAWSAPPILPRLPRLPDVRRSVRLPALYVTAPAQSFPVLKASRAHIQRAQRQMGKWSGASLGKLTALLKSKILKIIPRNRAQKEAVESGK